MYRHEDRPVARRGASAFFTLCLQPQHRREGESTSSSSVCLLPSLLHRECSAVEFTISVGVSPAQRAHTYLYSLHYLFARKTLPGANRVTLLNKAWRRGPPAPLLINYERVF